MGKQEKGYFIGAGICAIAFFVVCASIAAGSLWIHAFDDAVANVIHSWRTAELTSFVRVFTQIGGVAASVSIAVIIALVLSGTKRWDELWYFISTFLAGQAVLWGVKYACSRVRPTDNLIPLPIDPSFPSGHSFTSFMLCAFIAWFVCAFFSSRAYSRAYKIALVSLVAILTVGIGLSRIYLGVHWPTDVLGAWFLSFTVFCAGSGMYTMRRRKMEDRNASLYEGEKVVSKIVSEAVSEPHNL